MNAARERVTRAYEAVPYPGAADAGSHLSRLAAMARLHGLDAADPADCRVLELGCAAGHNLLPQAAEFPHSRFVGVDLSAAQIDAARAAADAVGLANLTLRAASLEEIDASWGHFDYVLCAGVYSWVPEPVQQRIFAVCRSHLESAGVAVISYNALPGWYHRSAVRDLMRRHVAAIEGPPQQIREARAILEFAAEYSAAESVQGRIYRGERDGLRAARDEYLFHDYLVELNLPAYLQDFVASAEASGLQFVSDADYAKQSGIFFHPAVQQVLAQTPLIQRYQLLDFLRHESFHRTILCHREADVRRGWTADCVQSFQICLAERPRRGAGKPDSCVEEFLFTQGKLTARDPLGRAALEALIEAYPRPMALPELLAQSVSRLANAGIAEARPETGRRSKLEQAILDAFSAGLLHLYLHPPAFERRASEWPVATRLARQLAEVRGQVVNQRHENVLLSDLQRVLLPLLDGSHDRSALTDRARQAVSEGRLFVTPGAELAREVESALEEIAGSALLVG